MKSMILIACICLLNGSLLWGQEGYRLTRTRVVVESAVHWGAWEVPIGSYRIGEDGTVEPRFLRRDINAMLNVGQFETLQSGGDTLVGGIRTAGSSPETAELIIDGDPSTYWEPDPEDELDRWYVDVELGRTVIAQRVVVRFVEEGLGDPFLKFRVMLSDGREQEQIGLQRGLKFYRVGQVARPNKEGREFSFEVHPQRPQPEGMDGEVAQVVRFEVLDTDGDRGREVGEEEYRDLAAEDRGAVEYFRQTVTGRQIPVDQETYLALPEEERGEIHYYRRERPRLAEVEVYTPGDNIINLTQRLRNRDVDLFENILRSLTTDGFYRSFYPLRTYDQVREKNQLEVDLGAKFWLDRIRLITAQGPIPAYQVRISDGTPDPRGHLIWEAFDERLNRDLFLQLEERFPLREVRYIDLRHLQLIEGKSDLANLSEIQAYGEGYVSEVTLTSPIIYLGQSRMFTTVEWEGEAPPGTHLEVRTRSGDQVNIITRYFDTLGREVTQEQYESMNVRNQGEMMETEEPGADWSNWSALYLESGVPFQSPSPRRMAMAQVRLLTRDPLRTARLSRLVLRLAPPLVDQTFAEIWPVEEVAPGGEQEFSLYIRPIFAPQDTGFDRMRIHSSSSVPIELISLKAGSDQRLRFGSARTLWPGEVEMRPLEDGSVELLFPETVEDGEQIYAVRFRTQVFLSGTTFGAELMHAGRPEVVQTVSEGDASALVKSQSLVVVADVEGFPLLSRVRAVPPVFTPNGDGINDRAEIRFSIFKLVGECRLEVEVFDLAGRRVRELSLRRRHPSGNHAVEWDGRDDRGRLLPPGSYAVRVGFTTDDGGRRNEAVSVVSLVY
jgi:hypothetical protein